MGNHRREGSREEGRRGEGKGGQRRRKRRGEERSRAEHHGALESNQDCQMPDTAHQLLGLGNTQVGQKKWVGRSAVEVMIHHAQASSTVVSPPPIPQSQQTGSGSLVATLSGLCTSVQDVLAGTTVSEEPWRT